MALAWRDALLSFRKLGPWLMSICFQAKVGQHLTLGTAYAPTDMGEDAAKDTFYLMLFACLKEAPTSDKVVVLGDFNAELGSAWQEQGGVTGKFHLHQGAAEPSDNVFVAAAKTVGTQGPVRRNRLGLTLGMLELVAAKRAAHLVWLSHPHSVAAQAAFHLANKRVKAVVTRLNNCSGPAMFLCGHGVGQVPVAWKRALVVPLYKGSQ
ncbi:unnamed protein product [Sphagnum compactum]